MADNKEKQATCPICGYTDTAMDAGALEDAMAEHMRMQHNQAAPVNPADTDLKTTGRRDTGWNDTGVPIAPGTTSGVMPGVVMPPEDNTSRDDVR